jgi:hypothetical protein
MSIDITDTGTFPNLSQYAVLAATEITSTANTVIANGYYGSSSFDLTSTGTLSGTGSPSGPHGFGQAPPAPQDALDAHTQLATFHSNLNTAITGLPVVTTFTPDGLNVVTLLSGVVNSLPLTTGLSTVALVLDAETFGGSAKFFITVASGALVLDNITSITLVNGANSNNVFWFSPAGISITGASPGNGVDEAVPGIFIATSQVTIENPINIAGRVFAEGADVVFNGGDLLGSNVDTTPYSGAAICFPRGTPINTDQGIMPIELIKPGVHTIGGQRIIAVPQSVQDFDDHLICFEKDSLGPDCPTARTLVSRNHAVLYNEKLVRAYDLVDDPELSGEDKVHKVPYSGERLFNILMDTYTTVTANNMVCETLDPDHHIAKLYQVNVSKHVAATACAC